ncbi:MAG: hypothetical protein JWQ27_2304 [Ferruginibacter sp.]|nr:hypothetical protein [Ferruginibacter sp.]
MAAAEYNSEAFPTRPIIPGFLIVKLGDAG